jgi:hypothetical protein
MTKPDHAPLDQFLCPQCDREVDEQWVACPACGLRLKPHTELMPRIVAWGAALLAYVWAVTLLMEHQPDAVWPFAILVGLPLCYIFGKAVVFRIRGKPLTWKQLGWTSLRTAVVSLGLMIVLPVLIGAALVVLLLVVCAGAMATGQF